MNTTKPAAIYHRSVALAMLNAQRRADATQQTADQVLRSAETSLYTLIMPIFNVASLTLTDTETLLREQGLYRHRNKKLVRKALAEADKAERMLFRNWAHQAGGENFYLDYLDIWTETLRNDFVILRESIRRLMLKMGLAHSTLTATAVMAATLCAIGHQSILNVIEEGRAQHLNVTCDYTQTFFAMTYAADQLVGQLAHSKFLDLTRDRDCSAAIDVIVNKAVSAEFRDSIAAKAANRNEQNKAFAKLMYENADEKQRKAST